MTTAPSNGRLHVLRAVEDGWSAFTKAPWSFILFTLLVGILSVIFQLVANAPSTYIEGPIVILLTITGLIGSVLINLWGVIGMVRASWIALEGTKPDFLDFSRWDGSAAGRLFVRSIALNILFLVILAVGLSVAFGLGQLNEALIWLPGIITLILFIYLSVNQMFLPYVALLEERSPFETVQRGRDAVDPSWWWVVLLLIVDALIIVIGTILCGVGLLVAAPVVACITTAAYRQLFGTTDHTGLLRSDASTML